MSPRTSKSIQALSVRQPYANQIATGRKTIEVRNWTTKHRGPLLICASQTRAAAGDEPVGVSICVVELLDVRPMTRRDERPAGCKAGPGLLAWVLGEARPVEQIPIKGRLRLFEQSPVPQVLPRRRRRS